jgi:hypothetical protein
MASLLKGLLPGFVGGRIAAFCERETIFMTAGDVPGVLNPGVSLEFCRSGTERVHGSRATEKYRGGICPGWVARGHNLALTRAFEVSGHKGVNCYFINVAECSGDVRERIGWQAAKSRTK